MTQLPGYLYELEERLAVNVERYGQGRIMNWEQIRDLAASGMEIGSHTVNHPILSRIPEKQVWYEIAESKKRLENQLRQSVTSFCYPNGKKEDFNETAKRLLKKAGYRSAVTTIIDYFSTKNDYFEIPRFYTTIRHRPTFSFRILTGRN